MSYEEKRVSYQTSNSYSSLNLLSEHTKNIWICFHGLGYLSKYFIQYFNRLNSKENYIIVPQAPSKYYQDKNFKYVGANWLTRENTQEDAKNIMNYLDEIFKVEALPKNKRLILFGYSQGVSVCLRWAALRKIQCNTLVIHSGGIPKELTPKDFDFLKAKVILTYGKQDEYLTPELSQSQLEMAQSLFGKNLEVIPFEGKHEVNRELIHSISKNNL